MFTIIGLIAYSIPTNHPLYTKPKRNCRRVSTDYGAKMCYQAAGSAQTSTLFTFCRINYWPDRFSGSNYGMTPATLEAFHTQCRSIENTLKRNYLSDLELDEQEDDDEAEESGLDDTIIAATEPPATPNGQRARTTTNLSVHGLLGSSSSASIRSNGFVPTPSPPAMVFGSSPTSAGINIDFPPKPYINRMVRSFPKPPPKEGGYKLMGVMDDAFAESDDDSSAAMNNMRGASPSPIFLGVLQYKSPKLSSRSPKPDNMRKRPPPVTFSKSAMVLGRPRSAKSSRHRKGRHQTEHLFLKKAHVSAHVRSPSANASECRAQSENDALREYREQLKKLRLTNSARDLGAFRSNRDLLQSHKYRDHDDGPRDCYRDRSRGRHRGGGRAHVHGHGFGESRSSRRQQHHALVQGGKRHKHRRHHESIKSNVSRSRSRKSGRSLSRSKRKKKEHIKSRQKTIHTKDYRTGDDRTSIRFVLNDNPNSTSARLLVEEQKEQNLHLHCNHSNHSIRNQRQRPKSAMELSRAYSAQTDVSVDQLCPSNSGRMIQLRSPSTSHFEEARRPRASTEPSLQELINPLDDSVFPCSKARWVPDKSTDQCMRCHTVFERSIFFISGKHHCRKCGCVVCSECSGHRLKGHRVCNECYRKYKDFEKKSGHNTYYSYDPGALSPNSRRKTTQKRSRSKRSRIDPMSGHIMANLDEERSEESSMESIYDNVDSQFERGLRSDSSCSGETDDGTVISVDSADSGSSRSESSRSASSLMYPTEPEVERIEDIEEVKNEQTPDDEKGFATKSFDLFMDSCSMNAGFNRRYLLKFIEMGYDDIRMMEFIDKQILLEEIGFQNRLSMNLILHRVEWLKESQREFKDIVTNKLKLPRRYLLLFNEQGIVNMEYLVRFAGDKAALKREIGITVEPHLDALCREMNLYQMGSFQKMSISQSLKSEGTETSLLSYQPGANGLDNTPGTPHGGTLLGQSLTASPAMSHYHSVPSPSPQSVLTISSKSKSSNNSNSIMYDTTKNGGIITTDDGEIVAKWISFKEMEWKSFCLEIEGVLKASDDGNWELRRYEMMMQIVMKCYEILMDLKETMTSKGSIDGLHSLMVNIECFFEEKEQQNQDLINLLNLQILKEVEVVLESNEAMVELRESMTRFVVKCCSVLWGVIQCEYTLFPKAFAVDETLNGYDPLLHEKECDPESNSDSNCNTIQYCTFPAIVHDGVYLSKMFVVCSE